MPTIQPSKVHWKHTKASKYSFQIIMYGNLRTAPSIKPPKAQYISIEILALSDYPKLMECRKKRLFFLVLITTGTIAAFPIKHLKKTSYAPIPTKATGFTGRVSNFFDFFFDSTWQKINACYTCNSWHSTIIKVVLCRFVSTTLRTDRFIGRS